MKQTYLDIVAFIRSLNLFQWVDLFNGQPEIIKRNIENTEYPIPLPAVFVEFGVAEYKTYNTTHERAEAVPLVFHVVQEVYSDTYDQSTTQTAGLAILDLVQQLVDALDGISFDSTDTLQEPRIELDTDYGNVVIHKVTFAVGMYRLINRKPKVKRWVSPNETVLYNS